MSTETIREAIEREPVEAEAEPDAPTQPDTPEPEPTQPDAPEPTPGPEPTPEPPSDAAIEKTYAAIQTKATNYTKAQQTLLAETGIPWDICPTCQVAGFVAPFDPNDPGEWERKAATDAYFQATEPEYREAQDTETCPDCDGYGELLSHSKRPEHRLKTCGRCGSLGWVARGTAGVPATVYPANGAPPVPMTATQAPDAQPDLWQRPFGHRDYGIPPALVNV